MGPLMIQCVRHYVLIDVEYSIFRNELVTVFKFRPELPRFYMWTLEKQVQALAKFEDLSLLRQLEAPLTPPPNPFLMWERHDGATTSSEERKPEEDDGGDPTDQPPDAPEGGDPPDQTPDPPPDPPMHMDKSVL
eukprot:1472067-Amphidinium_carterae.1